MKKKLSLTLAALSLFIMGTGCAEDEYRFRLSDDPGYVTDPVVSVRALDGDRWIQGNLDNAARTVHFDFHVASTLENVVLDVELDKNWAGMTSPTSTRFEANLKNGYKFTVNDGVDDVSYTVTGEIYQLIKSVKATLGSETVDCSLIDNSFSGTFSTAFLLSDLVGIDIELELGEGTDLVSDPSILKDVDFSSGEGLKVVLKDKSVGKDRIYLIYANPSNVVNLGSDWTESTKTWQNNYNIEFGNMRMYISESLFGYNGNVGYLFTVPAGRVEMKVLEKNDVGAAVSKMSPAVRNNRGYTLFYGIQGPGIFHTDGSTSTSGFTYYSPLAYGPDKNNVTKVLRNDGFGGSQKVYAPALGIQDNKVSMHPAGAVDGKLYMYQDAKGNGAMEWTPEAATGGYFQIVKDGSNLISAEGDRYYSTYNTDWRLLGENMTVFTLPDWGKSCPIIEHDQLRTGRIGIGCTAKGDLVILTVEKFVNTHNQGQMSDKNHNGASSDLRGLTLYELAEVMVRMGCSDVMTVEDYNWSYLLLQDGTDRGKDVFWTNNRWWIDTSNANYGNRKDESAEHTDMIITCFR